MNTFSQLHSTIQALRTLQAKEGLASHEAVPLVGQTIDGLAGVYVGQTARGKSFNGTMSRLFGRALSYACNAVPLPGSQTHVNAEWIHAVVAETVRHAQQSAEENGVSSQHHAFLHGQPVQEIMDALRTAQ